MNFHRPPFIARLAISTTLLACAAQAHAALRVGDSTPEGVAAGNTPELALIIWDPVKEVSYTKDLGIAVYKENYAAGDPSTNLFVYGQQDAGYQKLFDPLNTDANFQSFLSKSTDVANQIWAVIAVSNDPNAPAFAGGTSFFTTLNAATPTGTPNPQYTYLLGLPNSDFANGAGTLAQSFGDISAQAGSCSGACVTDFGNNSSYLNVKGQTAYAGSIFRADHTLSGAGDHAPNIFNPVNRSSWFYTATVTSDNSTEPIAVDEFDNGTIAGGGHDAYWGLGVDGSGNYILSYTLEAAVTPTSTAAGALLRLRTDFAAAYGRTRLIASPAGDAIDLGGSHNVTAVPEPATWGLMGLGLAVVGLRARRRR